MIKSGARILIVLTCTTHLPFRCTEAIASAHISHLSFILYYHTTISNTPHMARTSSNKTPLLRLRFPMATILWTFGLRRSPKFIVSIIGLVGRCLNYLLSRGVTKSNWVILDICKQINPPFQSNWIGGDVSSRLGVVVAEVVVMETGLLVVVLTRIYSDTSPPKKACFLPL
jgi:hypothetical protein